MYSVVGTKELTGTTFARCSTEDKAVRVFNYMKVEGFMGRVAIIQDDIAPDLPIDTLRIGEQVISV